MTRARVPKPVGSGVVLLAAVFVFSGCVFSETGESRLVTTDSALLTGTLQSTAADRTQFWFEYGTTTNYGTDTAHILIDLVTGTNPVSVHVDGLASDTTYHYRLCNDVPGSTANVPFCGADRSVTTGSHRVTVRGSGTRQGGFFPFLSTITQSIDAVADPRGVGYVDGIVNDDRVDTFQGSSQTQIVTTGRGVVSCLRVRGNIAVAGYTATYVTVTPTSVTTAQASRLFVIEDNGPTGDRYTVVGWTPSDGCPDPTSTLLGTTTADSAFFVISRN